MERTGLMGGEECPNYKFTKEENLKGQNYLYCNKECIYGNKVGNLCETKGLVEKVIGQKRSEGIGSINPIKKTIRYKNLKKIQIQINLLYFLVFLINLTS